MISYLALGDSYTIGEQVLPEDSFPHKTVSLLKTKGIDAAAPVVIATTGWTTDELAASIREHNINETFSVVSLLIGVNNQYRGRSVENYGEEFLSLLNQAIYFAGNQPQHVFVLSIPDWGVTPFAADRDRAKIAVEIDAYNEACKNITEVLNCNYIDITDSTRHNGHNPDFLAPDLLHPSGMEYAVWASRLADKMVDILSEDAQQ